MTGKNRIDYERGQIDDVAIDGVTLFRMEAMDDRTMWIRLYRKGGKDVVFWLGAVNDKKLKLTASHNFDFDKDDMTVDVAVKGAPAEAG
jgi:hypothetical protein